MQVKCIVSGSWKENGYIISENKAALIIDPGGNAESFISYVEENGLDVRAIINTHAHFDHIVAVDELAKYFQCPFYLHEGDKRLLRSANLYMTLFMGEKPVVIPVVDFYLDETKEPLMFNELSVKIVHTPGHTDGSICLLINDHLFTGDTLMKNSLGRTDLPGGNKQKLAASLRKIGELDHKLIIYPGHGEMSSLAEEFNSNEMLLELLQ